MAVMSGFERPIMSTSYLPLALALAVFVIPVYAFYQIFLSGKKPQGVAWAPSGKRGIVSGVRSCFASIYDLQDVLLKERTRVCLTNSFSDE